MAPTLCLLTAAVLAQGPAGTETPEYETLQQRPDRLVAVLPNRMIVVAQRVDAVPVVSAQVWVKTGSIYEQEHVGAGLSHFLEHLVSGGTTTTRSESENTRLLGEIGASTNAATSLDTVRYHINTTAEHAETAIDLLSDWMQNGAIRQEEFDREAQVIEREFAMGQADPGRVFWKLSQRARFANHPARHPTIGYLEEFRTITRDDVYDFYKRMYVPNNMVFVVVGDIDPREAVDAVAARWAEAEARELPAVTLPTRDRVGQRHVTGLADIQRPRLRLMWPNVRIGEEGDYALDVLGIILGQGESSRLTRRLRDELKAVTEVDAYNYSADWGPAFFGIDAEVDPDGGEPLWMVGHVKVETFKLLSEVIEQGVTEGELARAKRKVLARVLNANQTAEGIAGRLAGDVITHRDPDYLRAYVERINAVTAEDVRAAAERFLTVDDVITVTLMPQGDQTPDVMTRVPAAETQADAGEEPFDLDNRRVIAGMREQLKDAGHDRPAVAVEPQKVYTLDNGLTLIVQRSTVVPTVAMELFTLGGLLGDEHGREGGSYAVAQMLTRGTKDKSAEQLAQAVEDLGASLAAAAGSNTVYVAATALKEDFPAVLGLMAEVVQEPAFAEDEWQRMQPRLLAAIDRATQSIWGETRKRFREAYYGDHPWSQLPTGRPEVVKALTADDLRAIHAELFEAGQSVLAVVGDVDPEAVRAEAEKAFAKLPTEADGFDPPQPQPADGGLKQVAITKPGTAVALGFGPGIVRSDEDYAGLQVLSTVMSDFPAGWLEQELRGRGPGLVYGVGANIVTGLVPGYFSIVFNTQPEAAPEALARTMQVVKRARRGEFTEGDLARAKAKVLTRELFGKQSNASRAGDAALDKLYGVHDPTSARFIEAVRGVTAEHLEALADQYLRDPLIVVATSEPIDEAVLAEAAGVDAAAAAE